MYHRSRSALIGIGLLVGPTPLPALTRHVPSEFVTIQSALDASAEGDTVLVAPGTYTDVEVRDLGTAFPWTGCVFMANGVVLRSEAGPGATVIEMLEAPGPQAQVVVALDIGSAESAIEGFTITTPLPTRGVFLLGNLTIRNCLFRDLDAGQSTGGGIAANGNLTLIGCEFVDCRGFTAGAIYHANGWIEMYDCYVHECGSIAVRFVGSSAIEWCHVERCTFENNWATAGAGALATETVQGATIRDCRFIRNQGGSSMGAVTLFSGGPKHVERCLFLENNAAGPNGRGGGLKLTGPGTVTSNTFFGNTQTSNAGGAAISFNSAIGGPFVFSNNVIAGSGGTGGGIYAYEVAYALTTTCNVFWQNQGGTGLYYTPGPTDRIVDPLFCDVENENFQLMAGSPCLPEGSIGCGLIGAFGQGCGTIALEPSTWGQIKAAHRGREGTAP